MSEETKSADRTAAWGIVLAVGCSAISGLIYVLALMFSIQVRIKSYNGLLCFKTLKSEYCPTAPITLGTAMVCTYLRWCVQDPTDLATGSANGYIAGQIIYDVFLVGQPSTCPISSCHALILSLNRQMITGNTVACHMS